MNVLVCPVPVRSTVMNISGWLFPVSFLTATGFCCPIALRFRQDFAPNSARGVCGREAGVAGQVVDHLFDFSNRESVAHRDREVKAELVGGSHRNEGAECDQAAVPAIEAGPSPQ